MTVMSGTFNGATSFNQPIGMWDVRQVTTMANMFQLAASFNQSLTAWNTTNLKNTNTMFAFATNFNGNISGWDTHNVTDMSYMFDVATHFNQDISLWNTSKVTNMANMFALDNDFNQPLSLWDTSKVASMTYMFYNTSFNQNISAWNVSSVTTMANMFDNVALSTPNYNSLLLGWSTRLEKNAVPFSAGNSKYTNCSGVGGVTGRNILTGTYNWAITDAGPDLSYCSSCTYSGSGPWIIHVYDNCTIGTQTINNTITVDSTGGYLYVNGIVLARSISLTPSIFNGNFMVRIFPGQTLGVYK